MHFSDQISISILAASTEAISRNKRLCLPLLSSLPNPLPAPLIATEALPIVLIRTIPASTQNPVPELLSHGKVTAYLSLHYSIVLL